MADSSIPAVSLDPETERANIATRTALFDAQNPDDKFEPYKGKPKDIASIPAAQPKPPTSFVEVASDPKFKSLPEAERRKVIETLVSKDPKFQALPKVEQDKVNLTLFPKQEQPAKKAGFNPLMTPIALAEGLTSMVGSTAQAAVGGVAGLGTMATGKGFEKGYEAVNKTAEGIPFRAETDEGKAVEEVLSLIPQGIHWMGEKVFEATDSPVAGAATETAANAAMLLLGGRGIKKATEPRKAQAVVAVADTRAQVDPMLAKKQMFETMDANRDVFTNPIAFIESIANKDEFKSKSPSWDDLNKAVQDKLKGAKDAKGVESGQVLPEAKGKEGEVQRSGDMPVSDRPIPQERQASQEKKVAPQTAAIIEQQPAAVASPRFATVQNLSDGLYKLPQQGRAEMIQVLKKMKEIPPEDMEVLRSEKIYHSFEDPAIKLTADEARLKATYLEPIAKEAKRIYEKLETNEVEVDDTSYVPRKVRDKGGLLDRMATGQGFHPESGRALGRKADATKERTMFAIESPEGNRIVVAKASDGTLQGIKSGQPFKITDDASDLKPGSTISYGGKDWKFADAKTSEIEANTNLRYYKDAWAGMVDNLLQLKRMERELDFLNAWKKSPEFKKIATTATGSKIPQGWRQTDLPVLRGYHFEPHMAEVLDDFYNQPGSSALQTFAKINKVVTSSMFYNPLPHDFNVLDHWVVQRGARWAYPPAYVDLVATTAKAIKSVVTQDTDYIKMINEGAGLMYPSVLTEGFYTKLLGNLVHDPEMSAVAKAFGYVNPTKMIAGIYKAARHGLWAPSDMMMMQAYLEKMRNGEPLNKAIAETEKHIPNYRIPPRIGLDNQFGRALSQVMRNPVLSIFGRYHYGVLRSYGEMAKTMVGKEASLKERGDALGKMAMLGMMGLVVYPALSKLVQEVVGNTNAAFRRYGSAVVPYAVYEMLRGERTPEQVIQGTVTPAPVTKAMVELFTNTNLFNRQQIYNPNDSPMKIAGDVAKHAISSSYPFQQGAAIFSGKQSPEQVLESQIGVVDPTEKQVEAKRRWLERMKRKKGQEKEWTADAREPRAAP
jgi:hypothetical protein